MDAEDAFYEVGVASVAVEGGAGGERPGVDAFIPAGGEKGGMCRVEG